MTYGVTYVTGENLRKFIENIFVLQSALLQVWNEPELYNQIIKIKLCYEGIKANMSKFRIENASQK